MLGILVVSSKSGHQSRGQAGAGAAGGGLPPGQQHAHAQHAPPHMHAHAHAHAHAHGGAPQQAYASQQQGLAMPRQHLPPQGGYSYLEYPQAPGSARGGPPAGRGR